ncbi:methyltransferase domain-containing protein [Chitinophaga pinensis]|uniref:Methyltransferase type 12 n=1 Tax=Chitinophaga pinensis (strain ATCC 43595 / DSM 2588 / LMG 13176 / NBRC 15968 / NCIMB 11800 / UQM 2034) TaxID=485918 RepID=A0A979G0Z1_CHIPD|nr:methyltransferase domain-containing protein [Chitinophaga pinensis]ACU58767.1 Methyltransferase type 12 [Chitinophaga pinensis DSM 2588]
MDNELTTFHAGDTIVAANAGWTFSGKTVAAFDTHAPKSIPLYHEGHDLIVKLSDFFLSDDSVCYEIGCSTAELTKQLAINCKEKDVEIIGVDREADMISAAKEKCSAYPQVSFICDDILDIDLKKSDLIILYYTLQFIKPKVRQLVVDKIYNALNWGGALIMFEKVRANDARFQDIATSLYTEFKLAQGFTAGEILAKSRSLKGVLEPFSTTGNKDLLTRAGFVDILSVMKYVCFEGFLAIK